MDFKITSIDEAVIEIGNVLGIEKLHPHSKDTILKILLNIERNGKWDGVTNHNNWVASTDLATGIRVLSINKNRYDGRY